MIAWEATSGALARCEEGLRLSAFGAFERGNGALVVAGGRLEPLTKCWQRADADDAAGEAEQGHMSSKRMRNLPKAASQACVRSTTQR